MPQTVKKSRVTVTLAVIVLSAAAIAVETWLWSSRKYYLTSVIIILLAMLPFFARFEVRRPQVREIVLLPKEETYALSDQMRRAAVSVPSNIAEGYQRKSDGYIKNFLNMARGSNAELETQLLLCIRLGYISKTEAQKALQLTEELSKMLSGFINKLSNAVR